MLDVRSVAEPRIRQLDETTANQIAAGEVVERPASVVKELLENALDAGAQRITVEVEEGGSGLIRVTDDGCGMSPEDARLSLARHATSKIRSVSDLADVRTMGFRGEALPSIASVSRFTLTSRCADADEGVRLFVEGGQLRDASATGAALGTTVEVADLFFNVPARKKFLKRPATELGHISDAVVRLALAYPDVGIRLKHGAKVLVDVPPSATQDPKGRLARLLGRKVADALHPITTGPVGSVEVHGYAAEPTLTERTTRGQYVFVNRRFVRDRTVQHAIQDGYRTLMERGRHPVVILHLSVDPATFDVNVHPQKTEVRFTHTGDVHRAVTSALNRTLVDQPWLRSGRYAVALARDSGPATATFIRDAGDKGLATYVGAVPRPVPSGPAPSGPVSSGPVSSGPVSSGPVPSGPVSSGRVPSGPVERFDRSERFEPPSRSPVTSSVRPAPPWAPSPPAPREAEGPLFDGGASPGRSPGRFAALRPVGQVLGTYLVCQGPDEMVVIDQHAAHERIAFQRMRDQKRRARVAMQPLLMPIPVELDEGRAATAHAHAERLSEIGFELSPFGGPTWMVKGTPAALTGAEVERLILDLLDELASVEQTTPFEERIDALLSCAACHRVVRAGDRLTAEEIRALLVQMDEIDFGAHCPHGRPVFVQWSAVDLARLFHRT